MHRTVLLTLAAASLVAAACAPTQGQMRRAFAETGLVGLEAGAATSSASGMEAVAEPSADRVHALLINGGAKASANHWSHVEHIDGMVDALLARGVAPERIHVFAADGNDPEGDVSKRMPKDEVDHGWFLDATRLGWHLRPRLRLDSTPWPELLPDEIGTRVGPATTDALETWFGAEASRLRPGDTLLVYTTDHGIKGKLDLDAGGLALWGEELDVDGMRELLAAVPAGVRVAMVMSQCFSGTFAAAVLPAAPGRWGDDAASASKRALGESCGIFSVPRDRPAYGCFPEGSAGGELGHGYTFIDGMEAWSRLDDVHAYTLRHDATPDVPVTTSDVLVERTLAAMSETRDESLAAWLDPVLERDRQANPDDPTWLRVDAIARDHGLDLDELGLALDDLQAREENLFAMRRDLLGIADHWSDAVGPIAEAKLEDFVSATPDWMALLDPAVLDTLDDAMLAARRSEFAAALGEWMRTNDPSLFDDLDVLRQRSDSASDAAWRTALRIAGITRIRYALYGIAARALVAESPEDETLATLAQQVGALSACEGFAPGAAPGSAQSSALAPPEPLVALDEDVALRSFLEPVRLGVSFAPADGFPAGAARIERVVSESLAESAGLRRGDVVLGPPEAPFGHRMDLKRWVLTAPLDAPLPLVVQRGDTALTVEVGPFRDSL